MTIVMYASAIHEAVAKGDLDEMRSLLSQAEEHVAEWGNMPVALEMLRAEVKKSETRGSSD